GSYFIEDLTDRTQAQVEDYLKRIDDMGGAIAAIESGFIQREIQESAYAYHRDVESGQRTVVGVNPFIDRVRVDEEIPIHRIDAAIEQRQVERLKQLKQSRDNEKVENALKRLHDAAAGKENLIPLIAEAVGAYGTVGEIANTLRQAFGKFRPPKTL